MFASDCATGAKTERRAPTFPRTRSSASLRWTVPLLAFETRMPINPRSPSHLAWLATAATLLLAPGCCFAPLLETEGACVYDPMRNAPSGQGNIQCVAVGRRSCEGDSYRGTWHAYEREGSPAEALRSLCEGLGFTNSFNTATGVGYYASAPEAAPATTPTPAFVPTAPGSEPALAGAAVAVDAVAIPTTAPRRGAANPRVVIHVFSEFESPFSERLAPTLDRVMTEYGDRVLLVFRHLPLPFHARSEPAARAAMEVRAQLGDGAFWAYHDLLFANRSALSDAQLIEYAGRLPGIDLPRFTAALSSGAHADEIQADQAVARALGFSGTPSMRIGSATLNGAQPYERIRAAIDTELAR